MVPSRETAPRRAAAVNRAPAHSIGRNGRGTDTPGNQKATNGLSGSSSSDLTNTLSVFPCATALGVLSMRAVLSALAVSMLLYGTSLFSRGRDDPAWARSAHQEQAAQQFESVAALVTSLESPTTGSVEQRSTPVASPVRAGEDKPAVPAAGTEGADARSMPIRNGASKSRPAKVHTHAGRTSKPMLVASRGVSTDQPAPPAAVPVEYALAERGN